MNSDGSGGALWFADSEHSVLAPAWSADGARMAFGLENFFPTGEGFATSELALLDMQTRAVTRLSTPGDNAGFPSWSPNGRRIVFRKSTDEASALHILDLDENTTTVLLENFGSVHYPAWSPDGSVIQFTSDHGGDEDIYTIDPESRQIERLTNAPGNDGHGSWSPDGEWIAFLSVRGGYKDEAALNPGNPRAAVDLYVMRADGSDVRVLNENPFEEITPAWAPLTPTAAEPPPPETPIQAVSPQAIESRSERDVVGELHSRESALDGAQRQRKLSALARAARRSPHTPSRPAACRAAARPASRRGTTSAIRAVFRPRTTGSRFARPGEWL